LQDIVWRTAGEMGHGKYFVDRRKEWVAMNHAPFLKAGVASLDLIQLTTYPYWHKADDTADKVSAQSMKIVGEVVLTSLPKIAEQLAVDRQLPAPDPEIIRRLPATFHQLRHPLRYTGKLSASPIKS